MTESDKDLRAGDLPHDEDHRKRKSEKRLAGVVAGAMAGAVVAAVTGRRKRAKPDRT